MTLPWRPVVWLLLFQAGWEAVGLMVAGDRAYGGPVYDVLRQVPGGMRTYGPVLAALFVAAVWAFDRWTRGHPGTPLRVCLAVLAGWYVFWAVGTTAAWVLHRQVIAWPGPVRLGVVAALFIMAARNTPHTARPARLG